MNLMILGATTREQMSSYRGVDRITPYYQEELPPEHPVNRAFFWFCEEGGEFLTVHDVKRAKKLISLYRRLPCPEHYEIVEIAKTKSTIPNSQFLGFDVVAGSYSLLASTMYSGSLTNPFESGSTAYMLFPLVRLVREYFQPKLNINALFGSFDEASYYLECINSIKSFVPDMWENEEVVFEIVGLWKIPE